MKIALAQLNPIVGDVEGNARLIAQALDRARDARADLLVTPELAVVGYPPKDLVLHREFVEANVQAVQRIAASCHGIAALVGYVRPDPSATGKGVFNAAAL